MMKSFLELVELEVQELLESYDFPGDDIPFVSGSALLALQAVEGGPKERGLISGLILSMI